jgi:hypothetical protein
MMQVTMSTYQRSAEEGAREAARANVVLLNVGDLGDFVRTIQGPGGFVDFPAIAAKNQRFMDKTR